MSRKRKDRPFFTNSDGIMFIQSKKISNIEQYTYLFDFWEMLQTYEDKQNFVCLSCLLNYIFYILFVSFFLLLLYVLTTHLIMIYFSFFLVSCFATIFFIIYIFVIYIFIHSQSDNLFLSKSSCKQRKRKTEKKLLFKNDLRYSE